MRDRYTTAADLATDLNAWAETPARSPSRSKGWLWLFGVLALSAGIGLAPTVRAWLMSEGDRDSSNLKLSGSLPSGSVRIEKTTWPTTTASECSPIENGRSVRVYCDQLGLLKIGSLEERELDFSLEIRQLGWTGNVGIFFGYSSPDENEDNRGRLQILQLRRLTTKALCVSLSSEKFRAADRQRLSGEQIHDEPVPEPNSPTSRLRILIRDGALSGIYFNDARLDGFDLPDIKRRMPPATIGGFGIFVLRSSAVFSNISLNGSKLRVVVP
jgi:hypothetical protein